MRARDPGRRRGWRCAPTPGSRQSRPRSARPRGRRASRRPGGLGPQLSNGPDADHGVDPDSGAADGMAGDSGGGGSEASDIPDRDLPGLSFEDEGDAAAARPPGKGFGEGTEGTLAGGAATGRVPALPAVTEVGRAGGAALALTDAERKARRRRCAWLRLQAAGLQKYMYVFRLHCRVDKRRVISSATISHNW